MVQALVLAIILVFIFILAWTCVATMGLAFCIDSAGNAALWVGQCSGAGLGWYRARLFLEWGRRPARFSLRW
jgi:hypothetical protein